MSTPALVKIKLKVWKNKRDTFTVDLDIPEPPKDMALDDWLVHSEMTGGSQGDGGSYVTLHSDESIFEKMIMRPRGLDKIYDFKVVE